MLIEENRLQHSNTGRSKVIILSFFALIAFVGWIYIILQSDLFQITHIEVAGARIHTAEEVERAAFDAMDQQDRSWKIWSPRQSWFINTDKLADAVRQNLSADEVTIDKTSKHILRLSIAEYSHKVILYAKSDFRWMNQFGRTNEPLSADEVTRTLQRIAGKIQPISTDAPIMTIDATLDASTTIQVAPEVVETWQKLSQSVLGLGLSYREFKLGESVTSTFVTMIDQTGTKVYLTVNQAENVQKELLTYKLFLQSEKTKKHTGAYEYIDVRAPGTIYVK